jgi:hypothetical protein
MKPISQAVLLNPHAGSHPITSDERARAAAVRAGDRSVAAFPYYVERYGERGRLFGHSDSAWLVRVGAMSERQVDEKVDWLGTVLSARGIPQWLLARHLEVLEEELAAAVPEDADRHAALGRARRVLDARLLGVLDDARADALAQDFEREADAEWNARLPGMGRILVAAVVDEALGIEKAVDAVVGWAGDAERFPATWTAAVRRMVDAARAEVPSPAG